MYTNRSISLDNDVSNRLSYFQKALGGIPMKMNFKDRIKWHWTYFKAYPFDFLFGWIIDLALEYAVQIVLAIITILVSIGLMLIFKPILH